MQTFFLFDSLQVRKRRSSGLNGLKGVIFDAHTLEIIAVSFVAQRSNIRPTKKRSKETHKSEERKKYFKAHFKCRRLKWTAERSGRKEAGRQEVTASRLLSAMLTSVCSLAHPTPLDQRTSSLTSANHPISKFVGCTSYTRYSLRNGRQQTAEESSSRRPTTLLTKSTPTDEGILIGLSKRAKR